VVVAKLLDSEGYTDHLAGVVRKYAFNIATQGQRKRLQKIKKMFSELVKSKLDDKDRMILGKFMSIRLKMSFDVGIRMGLAAYLKMSSEEKDEFVIEVLLALGEEKL